MKKIITLTCLLFAFGLMAGEPHKKDCKQKCCSKRILNLDPAKDFVFKERELFRSEAEERIFKPGETALQLFAIGHFDRDGKETRHTDGYSHNHGDNKPGKGHEKHQHPNHIEWHEHPGMSYDVPISEDNWGGGVGVTHFQTLNWGYTFRSTAMDNGGPFFEDVAGGIVYRVPIECYRIAPYAKLDGGYSFQESHSLISVRGGVEFRPCKDGRWAVFAEGGYQWADQQYPVLYTGLSFLLGKCKK